jgi:hypothetical protein
MAGNLADLITGDIECQQPIAMNDEYVMGIAAAVTFSPVILFLANGDEAMKLSAPDIRAGVFVIQGSEARLVTEVDDDGNVTYCKFSADTGEPYGQPPAACRMKSLLVWTDRIASPVKAARYDPAAIIASSNLAIEKRLTGALAAAPLEYLLAELERRGVKVMAV